MIAARVAGGSVIELAGILLRERDQLLERARRHARVQHEDVRRDGELRDRREIALDVVARLLVERHVRGVGAAADEQRVAVGRRARDVFRRDVAAAAGPVLDDDGGAQELAQLQRGRPGHEIGAAARQVAGDHANRFLGIRLLGGGGRRCGEQ
jgi:hypothetical protein